MLYDNHMCAAIMPCVNLGILGRAHDAFMIWRWFLG